MARRKRSNDTRERDHHTIARHGLRPEILDILNSPPPRLHRSTPLLDFEDRRRFHPLGDYATPATVSRRSQARILDAVLPPFLSPSGARSRTGGGVSRPSARARSGARSVFQFASPNRVLVCVRRHRRREVLFAKRRTGKGSRSPKHRNYYSEVSCGRR